MHEACFTPQEKPFDTVSNPAYLQMGQTDKQATDCFREKESEPLHPVLRVLSRFGYGLAAEVPKYRISV